LLSELFHFVEFICLACWSIFAANGKSIGEVRAFEELKVLEKPNVANAFSNTANLQKNAELKSIRGLFFLLFNFAFTPHFANTMLCDVLFIYLYFPQVYKVRNILFHRNGLDYFLLQNDTFHQLMLRKSILRHH